MRISNKPFPLGPGFLRQPQPGTRQRVDDKLHVEAGPPGAPGAPDGTRPAKPAIGAVRLPGATGVSSAKTLSEAVDALRAEGRVPRRGSLVNLSA